MDRRALLADLKQARCCVDDAERNIARMLFALEQGNPIPRWERSHAAGNLNRASEYVRRSYEE